VHETDDAVQGVNDWTTCLEDIPVILASSCEVILPMVNGQDLGQLFLPQWSAGTRQPHEYPSDHCTLLFSLDPVQESAIAEVGVSKESTSNVDALIRLIQTIRKVLDFAFDFFRSSEVLGHMHYEFRIEEHA